MEITYDSCLYATYVHRITTAICQRQHNNKIQDGVFLGYQEYFGVSCKLMK